MSDTLSQETERYGHIGAWSRWLGIAEDVLQDRLKGIQGITGKLRNGTVLPNGFYAQTDVFRVCEDLISEVVILPDEDMDRYLEVMPESDDLTLIVLKGHLLIEEQLESIIKIIVAHGDVLEDARLTFDNKLTIAKSMCWSRHQSEMWIAIEKLNTLRNDLAHKLDSPKLRAKGEAYISALRSALNAEERAELKSMSLAEQVKMGVVYMMGFLGSYLADAHAYRTTVDTLYTILKSGKVPEIHAADKELDTATTE